MSQQTLKEEFKEKLSDIMIWIKVQPHEDYSDAIIKLFDESLDKHTTHVLSQVDEVLGKLVVHTPDEVAELNKHLPNTLQEESYLIARGYLYAISDAQEAIKLIN